MSTNDSATRGLPGEWGELYLELPVDLEVEGWLQVVAKCKDDHTGSHFRLGDALNHGEDFLGEEYYQAFDSTDYAEGTLRNIAWVCRQVPTHMRCKGVRWSAYYEIASIKDEHKKRELISRCAEGEFTVRDLQDLKREDEYDGVSTMGKEFVFVVTEDRWDEFTYVATVEGYPSVRGYSDTMGEAIANAATSLSYVLNEINSTVENSTV